MQLAMVPMPAALALAACAATPSAQAPSFAEVRAGNVATSGTVRLEGLLDASGIAYYSVFPAGSADRNKACIGLILSDADRKLANERDGAPIAVTGRIVFVTDLPRGHATINRRTWAGTPCFSETVILVTRLRFLSAVTPSRS